MCFNKVNMFLRSRHCIDRIARKPYFLKVNIEQPSLSAQCKYQSSRYISSNSPRFNMRTKDATFRLTDYDSVGFDLDNTLLRYKVANMVQLEYNVLAKFLVNVKGYSGEHLMEPIDMDFLQKGLIIDFERGNLLKLGANGCILKAAHGTRQLQDLEIDTVYGSERTWEVTTAFAEDLLVSWYGPYADRMRTLLDYFDMPASLIFARIIDSLDAAANGQMDSYNVWPDILDGLIYMYTREHFAGGVSPYFAALQENPDNYIHRSPPKVVELIRELKKQQSTFLVTGSHVDYASFTATYSLGEDWRNLFDGIVCFAKKPGFFTAERPFLELDGATETNPVLAKDLVRGQVYSQGNLTDLLEILAIKPGAEFNANTAKILYVGDNLIQDVFAPKTLSKCDTVAVVEEMWIDGIETDAADAAVLHSKRWGSYFGNITTPSLWSKIIRKHSKLCVPSVEELTVHPLDHEYSTFGTSDTCTAGFYPKAPSHTTTKDIN